MKIKYFLIVTIIFAFLGLAFFTTKNKTQEKIEMNLVSPYDNFNYFISLKQKDNDGTEKIQLFKNKDKISESTYQSTNILFTQFLPYSDGQGFYKAEYIKEGRSFDCGAKQAQKNNGVRDEIYCITNNDKKIITSGLPAFVDKDFIIYQKCEKFNFYPLDDLGIPGNNQCQEYSLIVNNKTIDKSFEYYQDFSSTGKGKILNGAAQFKGITFNKERISYLKINPEENNYIFVIINIETGEKTEIKDYRGMPLAWAELVENEPALLVWDKNLNKNFFYKEIEKENIDSFKYFKGNFYFIKPDPSNKGLTDGFNILRDDISLLRIDSEYFPSLFNSDIKIYPNCDSLTLVCIYNNNNFSSKSGEIGAKRNLYINGIDMKDYIYLNNLSDIFIFSKENETYAVYTYSSQIRGVNIDSGKEVVLFEFKNGTEIIDFKAFPKKVTN